MNIQWGFAIFKQRQTENDKSVESMLFEKTKIDKMILKLKHSSITKQSPKHLIITIGS